MSEPQILIVEDDPDFGPLLRTLLGRLGYRATLAPSGASAMQYATQRDFDIITLDINIPDIDGVDLLEHFKATLPTTPVIMATAQSGSDRVIRCLRLGAFDFLKKPFDLSVLKPTIERALEHRRLRQTAVLYRGSQAITETREPAGLPNALVDYGLEAFACDWCGVLTEADGLVVSSSRGEALRERINARMLTKLPAMLDLGQHEGGGLLEDGHIALHGLRSVGRFNGVLALWRERNRPPFRRPDLEIIGVYAGQASLALENARLMTRLRERVEALERVRARMATAGHLEAVGRRSVAMARKLQAPVSIGRVYLRNAMESAANDTTRSLIRRAVQEFDAVERAALDIEAIARSRDNVATDIRRILETAASLALDDQASGITLGEIASASVPGQPGDLVQMLVHLLDNASRALQRAGRPLQGNVLVTATFDSNQLTLTLADKGCGMDNETLKRWGEPFFSPWGSTGLGIAMCANIVARHEGTLHVHSTPGEGTRVSVVLPAVMELEEFAMDSVSSLTDEQGGGLTDGVEIQDSWDDEEQSTDPGF